MRSRADASYQMSAATVLERQNAIGRRPLFSGLLVLIALLVPLATDLVLFIPYLFFVPELPAFIFVIGSEILVTLPLVLGAALILLFVSLAQPRIGHTIVSVGWLLAGGWGLALLVLELTGVLRFFYFVMPRFLALQAFLESGGDPLAMPPNLPLIAYGAVLSILGGVMAVRHARHSALARAG